MRLTTLISAFALTSPAFAWSDFRDSAKCGAKTPAVNTAIEKFCEKDHIMVPSKYASKGVVHDGFKVAISGHCNPPQWVPYEYCRTQFAKLCANGNSNGLGHQRYGQGGCQGWHINRVHTSAFGKE